ncbi:uncharacterized protein SCODWIG_00573 [Saccharomycodes ludwigii]|uniref:Maintenance of telomere capping protein 6 n=1 Tax=Saccharomycodes ludwigii TaxID=36035 RepID=A0A376B2G0_9ASCO|nr:uncharacterized protein SCODWIG_00573 [Saccharomycodes ludwigii]
MLFIYFILLINTAILSAFASSVSQYSTNKIKASTILYSSSFDESFWPNMTDTLKTGLLSQRDLLRSVPIDQIPRLGVNLSQLLSPNEYYFDNDSDKLNYTLRLLSVGVRALGIDLVYSLREENWYLQNTNISFFQILSLINQFSQSMTSSINVDFLLILLNFPDNNNKTLTTTTTNSNNITSASYTQKLSDLDNQIIQFFNYTQLFTQNDYNGTWPTLDDFLFNISKKLLFISPTKGIQFNNTIFPYEYIQYLPNNKSSDFICPVNNHTSFHILADNQYDNTTIKNMIYCGYSPLIGNTNLQDVTALLNTSLLWSWKDNEPIDVVTSGHVPLQVKDRDTLEAYACASLQFSNGESWWIVDNCYAKQHILCGKDDSNMWAIGKDSIKFFDVKSDKNTPGESHYGCPTDYSFAVPNTPLKIRSVNIFLTEYTYNKSLDSLTVWIDLNSIIARNCWVIGAADANCPYTKYVSSRSFVAMIVPLASVTAALLATVIFLKVQRLAIQDNRKNWRKIIKATEKNEPGDGVPS